MVVLGALFKCLDPILIIGAAAEERGLFIKAPDVKKESMRVKTAFMGDSMSEHIAVYNAFDSVRRRYSPNYERPAQAYASSLYIHMGAFRAIYGSAKQMEEILGEFGLIPRDPRMDTFGFSPAGSQESERRRFGAKHSTSTPTSFTL